MPVLFLEGATTGLETLTEAIFAVGACIGLVKRVVS